MPSGQVASKSKQIKKINTVVLLNKEWIMKKIICAVGILVVAFTASAIDSDISNEESVEKFVPITKEFVKNL